MNRTVVLLCLTPVLLAACSSDKKEPQRLCPQTAIVRELDLIKDYGGESPDEKAVVAVGAMRNVKGECRYTDDGVRVDFALTLAAERGERLGGKRVSFPFFVSVVDPEGKILSKQRMTADAAFSGSEKIKETTEELRVFIPMGEETDGGNYRVLIGFQLTEEQLESFRKTAETPTAQ